MVFSRVEQVKEDFIVLRPVYVDGANATEIWLKNGEILYDKRGIKGVLKAVGRTYMIDFSAQKKKVAELLQRTAIVPFYIDAQRVFVPVKLRKALTNDAVYGYVDLAWLQQVDAVAKNKCRAVVGNGMEINIFSSRNTVVNSQNNGQQVREMLADQVKDEPDEEQVIDSFIKVLRDRRNMLRQLDRLESMIAELSERYEANK
ncbi:MAG: hypothetical protein PHU69_10880, partial [Fermentimonas sp.]|nr:hypothetical protein [Fermentimonas sp.]